MDGIPPQYQLFTALVIGVLVAIGAAYKFFSDLRRDPFPPPTVAPDSLRMLGAALGDSQALDRVREELRELRAAVETAARNTVEANELMAAIGEAIRDVADAIRGTQHRRR